jgi:hypothetical protein
MAPFIITLSCHPGQASRSGARAGIQLFAKLDSGSAAHRFTLPRARNDNVIFGEFHA